MLIENAEKWFELNDIKKANVNGLCEEVCAYLSLDMVKHKTSLIRSFSTKSKHKVIFPLDIGVAHGDIKISSPKQGNLESFPEEVRGTISLEDCSIVSLSGRLKKVDTLKLGSNQLESLDNLPECRSLDISFNPIKDIKAIEDKNVSFLSMSIFHLNHNEIIEIFRSILKTSLQNIIVFQPYHSNHHEAYLHGGKTIQKVFVPALGLDNSNAKIYDISRKTMEIMVLNSDLERDIPLANDVVTGLVKF